MLRTNLHCGGLIKFEGFCLPILHVDLKHIGQKEKGVSLGTHTHKWYEFQIRKKKKYVLEMMKPV